VSALPDVKRKRIANGLAVTDTKVLITDVSTSHDSFFEAFIEKGRAKSTKKSRVKCGANLNRRQSMNRGNERARKLRMSTG